MSAHDHTTIVPGCFRCDLNEDERPTNVEVLLDASREARLDSFNGMNELRDALADWWQAESDAHFHDSEGKQFLIYNMPGMENAPAVRAARAYLEGQGA